MAAMDAQKQRGVEPSRDGADRQIAEIFLFTIVDVGVVRVGADGENVLERNIPPASVLLDADRLRVRPGREWRLGGNDRGFGRTGRECGGRGDPLRRLEGASASIRDQREQEGPGNGE